MALTFDAYCEASVIPAELLQESAAVLECVKNNIVGRSADVSEGGINTRIFACLSVIRGDGDVLEIGSFFGASAITAELLRKTHGVKGQMICLDPLDGRQQMVGNKPQETGYIWDDVSGKRWDAEILAGNAKKNNASPRLVQKPSQPFPLELQDLRFTLVFIDGDHWHDAPRLDFESVKDLTNCVIFDDYDEDHPHVAAAVKAAIEAGWEITLEEKTLCVLERLN